MPTFSQKQIEYCWKLLNKGGSADHIRECFDCSRDNALALQRETIQQFGKPEHQESLFNKFLNGKSKKNNNRPKAEYSNHSPMNIAS